MFQFLNEQLILLATIVATIAALPTLIEFLLDRRKRQERIFLALSDEDVDDVQVRLAGLDGLLARNADLIDAARHPEAYIGSNTGNEILVLGPTLSGRQSLARKIAKDAAMDRIVTVHNPRNADALAYAKTLLKRYRRGHKVMLVVPDIDLVLDRDEEGEARAELDALIESNAEVENVLVVATASRFAPDSELDSLFGIKIVMPGTRLAPERPRQVTDEGKALHREVAAFYLDGAVRDGFALALDRAKVIERLVGSVGNAGEVQDLVSVCRTSALHRHRTQGDPREIRAEDVDRAIARVIVPATAD